MGIGGMCRNRKKLTFVLCGACPCARRRSGICDPPRRRLYRSCQSQKVLPRSLHHGSAPRLLPRRASSFLLRTQLVAQFLVVVRALRELP